MKTIHKEILCCLETKLNELQAVVDAMPSYGSSPPAHNWETSLLNEGSREYDDAKDLMWTLVENPVAAISWFWAFDFSAFDADADGLADEQIDVYDVTLANNFSIAAGANIAQALMVGFGVNNGVQTLVHRDGSTYYMWQIDDGSQANPIINSAVECDYFKGAISLTEVQPGAATQVVSRWVNKSTNDA